MWSQQTAIHRKKLKCRAKAKKTFLIARLSTRCGGCGDGSKKSCPLLEKQKEEQERRQRQRRRKRKRRRRTMGDGRKTSGRREESKKKKSHLHNVPFSTHKLVTCLPE